MDALEIQSYIGRPAWAEGIDIAAPPRGTFAEAAVALYGGIFARLGATLDALKAVERDDTLSPKGQAQARRRLAEAAIVELRNTATADAVLRRDLDDVHRTLAKKASDPDLTALAPLVASIWPRLPSKESTGDIAIDGVPAVEKAVADLHRQAVIESDHATVAAIERWPAALRPVSAEFIAKLRAERHASSDPVLAQRVTSLQAALGDLAKARDVAIGKVMEAAGIKPDPEFTVIAGGKVSRVTLDGSPADGAGDDKAAAL